MVFLKLKEGFMKKVTPKQKYGIPKTKGRFHEKSYTKT